MNNLEQKIPPVLQMVLTILAMFGIVIFWRIPPFSTIISLPLGLFLITIGIVFIWGGVASFIRAKTTTNPIKPEQTSTLVVEGIYKKTRNPMYVGFLLVIIAFGIWLSPYTLLLAIAHCIYMTQFQIIPEERILEEKFGTSYQQYKKTVRRWV